MNLLEEHHDQLDHALLSGQLTTERLAELAPRTRWTRIETHPQVVAQPYVVGLGTYLQPQRDGLRAIVTLDLADDLGAGNWLHLSVSRARRLPTWGDLVSTRDALGYAELYFLQQLPPRRYWLNVHRAACTCCTGSTATLCRVCCGRGRRAATGRGTSMGRGRVMADKTDKVINARTVLTCDVVGPSVRSPAARWCCSSPS